MPEDKLLVEKRQGGIALLILNRPHAMNAVDHDQLLGLPPALEELGDDDEVKVIILTGRGDHFSSGGDLKDVSTNCTVEGHRKVIRHWIKPVKALVQLEKPVIAMVKGYALGGGASLVLACDIVYASQDARFAWPFLRMGVVPEWGASLLLPMLVGLNRAKELLFGGETIDAAQACSLGVVNKVFPGERLEEETMAFAQAVGALPADAVRMTKRRLNADFCDRLENTLEWEMSAVPFCVQTAEFKDRVASFQQKKTRSFLKQ